MRIAVSGTHCSGKSTLIDDFLAAHPDYAHEPEPYEWLSDDDFDRQLEMCVEGLRGYDRGARVIAERSPLDFLAYMLACDGSLTGSAIELAALGMKHVDLLVVLPLDGSIAAPEDEDPELREAMNERLLEIVGADDLDARVVELHGPPHRRLAALEAAVATA